MDSTNECTWLHEHLDEYLRRDAEAEVRARGDIHLEACSACSELMSGAREYKQRLRAAVATQSIPPDLHSTVRATLAAEPRAHSSYWMPLAAAAALVIATVGVWMGTREAAQPAPDVAAVSTNFMEVGLAHDIHCASARPEPASQLSVDELVARMDSEYSSLVPAVAATLTGGMHLVDAHKCRYRERQFLHLVMRDGDARVSMLITDLQGLDRTPIPGGQLVSLGDEELFRIRRDGSDLTATQVGNRIVYVVSDSSRVDSIDLARTILPVSRPILQT